MSLYLIFFDAFISFLLFFFYTTVLFLPYPYFLHCVKNNNLTLIIWLLQFRAQNMEELQVCVNNFGGLVEFEVLPAEDYEQYGLLRCNAT